MIRASHVWLRLRDDLRIGIIETDQRELIGMLGHLPHDAVGMRVPHSQHSQFHARSLDSLAESASSMTLARYRRPLWADYNQQPCQSNVFRPPEKLVMRADPRETSRRGFLKHSLAAGGIGLAGRLAIAAEPNTQLPQPMFPVVDSHQHLWDLKKFKLPWTAASPSLARDYLDARLPGSHGRHPDRQKRLPRSGRRAQPAAGRGGLRQSN